MSVQVFPSVDDCHFVSAPVSPLIVIVVLVPLQIGLVVALALPATVIGSTTTVAATELPGAHTPLCTTARNCVVIVRLPVGNGLAVEPISVQFVPSVEDCHFVIAPVSPLRLIVVLVPLHIGLVVAHDTNAQLRAN